MFLELLVQCISCLKCNVCDPRVHENKCFFFNISCLTCNLCDVRDGDPESDTARDKLALQSSTPDVTLMSNHDITFVAMIIRL